MLYRFRGLAVIALWQAAPIVAHEDSTGRVVVHFAGGVGRYEQVSTDCDGNVLASGTHPFGGGGAGAQVWLGDHARINGFVGSASSGAATMEPAPASESAAYRDPGEFDGAYAGALLALEWRYFGIGAGVMSWPADVGALPAHYLRIGNIDRVHARTDMVPFDGSYTMAGTFRMGLAANMGHLRGTRFFGGLALCHASCEGDGVRGFIELSTPIAERWDIRLGGVAGPGRVNPEFGLTLGASWMPNATRRVRTPAVEPVPTPAPMPDPLVAEPPIEATAAEHDAVRRAPAPAGEISGAAAPAAELLQAADSTRRVRLARDTVASGVRCAPTGDAYAEFFVRDGRLAECPLAEDVTLAGHALRAGTWLVFRSDGSLRLAWLVADTRIGSVVCKGTGYKDWATTFHDDGSLATCYLPETTTIDGVPCRPGTIWGELTGGVTTRFHPNGRLASCSLARATTIQGERHRAWSRVHLDAQGLAGPE